MNFKEFLNSLLSNTEITNLLGDKEVYFLHATNPTTPYLEYEIYDENGEEWAENKEIATNYYVQIDIFSESDYSTIEEKVKEKMINAGFDRSMAADFYESSTGLNHKAMRFIFTTNTN